MPTPQEQQQEEQQQQEQEVGETPEADHEALLPQGEPAEADWGPWTKAVAAQTGAKGRGLFMPLRLALTGRPHGPELKKVLPLIGRDRALARLQGRRA